MGPALSDDRWRYGGSMEQIVATIQKKVPEDRRGQVEEFARQYYQRLAPEDLIELERRRECLAQLMKNGDLACFALFSSNRCATAAFDAYKIFSRIHWTPWCSVEA